MSAVVDSNSCLVNNSCPSSTDCDNGETLSIIPSGSNNDQSVVVEEPPEVLGSVVQSHDLENGEKNSSVQLRTSARVSKKMRMDFIANQTPTPPERKDLPKEEDKLDSKPKRKPFELWPAEDKNTFFEALNEYGKDFDAIQRFFEAKSKRRNLQDHVVKSKEQIRYFYYRTWHKISKHLRFPEEVKKATQELYGLINFGEIRKKIRCLSEKNSFKLNELIYRGFTTIRIRGKNIRVKTPICRALRKLNQQEELAEDLKLPARVTVELRPRTNEAWARVQATSQNPRIRTLLPLQRRLALLLNFLEQRWQPHSLKHCERLQLELNEVTANMESTFEASSAKTEAGSSNSLQSCDEKAQLKSNKGAESTCGAAGKDFKSSRYILRVAPKSDATITPLTVNLSEYFTSSRLSLNSHEERLGNNSAEQLFNSMLHASSKGCGRRGNKRQRHDSSSEKKKEQLQQLSQQNIDSSPEKSKDGSLSGVFPIIDTDDDKPSCPFRLFGSGVNLEATNHSADPGSSDSKSDGSGGVLSISKSSSAKDGIVTPLVGVSVNGGSVRDNGLAGTSQQCISSVSSAQESNEEIIKRVRAGWTVQTANAITLGELYLMFGADSKVRLEYWWEEKCDPKPEDTLLPTPSQSKLDSELHCGQNLAMQPKVPAPSNQLSAILQKLLSISKMYSSQAKCPCGHVCNGTPKSSAAKAKVTKPVRGNADVDKLFKTELFPEIPNGSSPTSTVKICSPVVNDGPFRRPLMPSPQFKPPPRPGTADAFKAQLEKFRPRGCNRRGRPVSMRKNVVVPRMLPLLPKAPSSSPVMTFQVIPQNTHVSGDFLPVAQSSELLNYTPSSSSPTTLLQPSMPSLTHNDLKTSTQVASPDSSGIRPNQSMPDLCISMPDLEDENPAVDPAKLTDKKKPSKEQHSCHLVQDLFPPTLDTPVNSPPSISNLLDLSLQSDLSLNSNPLLEPNFAGLLSNSGGVSSSPPPTSLSTILKEDDNQWLNSEVADFSLSSFLGHLESPMKTSSTQLPDNNEQSSISSDVERQMQCLMTDSSLDYVANFADFAARITSNGASKS